MKTILILILVVLSGSLFSQNTKDSIEIKNTFFGPAYKCNGKYLTPAKIRKIVRVNPEADKVMGFAGGYKMFSDVFSFAGGFLIGYPIGTHLVGREKPNWQLAVLGGGLVLIAIPFAIGYSKRVDKAVRIYNDGIRQTTQVKKLNFELGYTSDGIGVRMKF